MGILHQKGLDMAKIKIQKYSLEEGKTFDDLLVVEEEVRDEDPWIDFHDICKKHGYHFKFYSIGDEEEVDYTVVVYGEYEEATYSQLDWVSEALNRNLVNAIFAASGSDIEPVE